MSSPNPTTEDSTNQPRKFKCDTCQRLFNRREHLQRHESTHNNVKPFHCTLCRYSCRRRDLLNRHVKLSHSRRGANDRNYRRGSSEIVENTANVLIPQGSAPPYDATTAAINTTQDVFSDADSMPVPPVLHNASEMEPLSLYSTGAEDTSVILTSNAPPFLGIEGDPEPFAFNYLDNVCLPPFYDQATMYPNLSLADPFTSPSMDIGPFPPDQIERTGHAAESSPRVVSQLITHNESDRNGHAASFVRVSQEDWQWLTGQMSQFPTVIPAEYQMPSRHAISRYLHGFLTGFHPHFPVIHPQTLSFRDMAPELILALVAVGSHYCLESHQGLKLFSIARGIALEQLRRRDIEMDSRTNSLSLDPSWPLLQSPKSLPSLNHRERDENETQSFPDYQGNHADLETMQALFFLMAMATWGGEHRSLVRQAIATQSILAMLVRQHGLSEHSIAPRGWEDWARQESARRTKLIIFCFFNLHTIVFNLPSPILVGDIQLRIPCSEWEWKMQDSASWMAAHQQSVQPPLFQDCFTALLQETNNTPTYSSLGGHILIHAMLQRIISIRNSTRLEGMENEMFPGLSAPLRRALKKWQSGWEQNPESSYSPLDKHGPIAFNSRALYQLAHIRFAVDIGSSRSLLEQSPAQIAKRLLEGPRLQRGPRLLVAARHSAAALCSPVQMGVHFVGRAPSWSVMHAVCSLEYAYTLNQFLQATTPELLEYPLEEEEKALLATVKETLLEVETSTPGGNPKSIESEPRLLGPKVVRAWGIVLDGMRTWNAVCVITKVLFLYADLLEQNL